jgi:hypothetical protein
VFTPTSFLPAGGAGGSAEMNGSTVRMYVRDAHGRRVALEQTPILRMAAIGSRGAAGGAGGARAAGAAAPTPRCAKTMQSLADVCACYPLMLLAVCGTRHQAFFLLD